MALPLANLYLHLDSTNPSSNPVSGTTWFDLTANNLDYSGGDFPSFTTEGTKNTLTFTNEGDLITTNNNLGDLFTGGLAWSIEMYFRPTTGQTNQFFFGSYADNELTGFALKSGGANGATIQMALGLGGESLSPLMDMPDDAGYQHYVFARTANSSVSLYRNGSLVTTWNIGAALLNPSSLAYSIIGRRTTSGGIYGLGEFGIIRVWNVALSAGQVSEAYTDATNTLFPPPYVPNVGGGRQFGEGFN